MVTRLSLALCFYYHNVRHPHTPLHFLFTQMPSLVCTLLTLFSLPVSDSERKARAVPSISTHGSTKPPPLPQNLFFPFCASLEFLLPSLPTPPAIRRLIPQRAATLISSCYCCSLLAGSVFELLVRLVDDYFWLLNSTALTLLSVSSPVRG